MNGSRPAAQAVTDVSFVILFVMSPYCCFAEYGVLRQERFVSHEQSGKSLGNLQETHNMNKNSFGAGLIVGVITFFVCFSGFPLYGHPLDFVGFLGVGFGHGFSASVVAAMLNKRQKAKAS